MKRVYVTTALTCLVILIAVIGGLRLLNLSGGRENLTVGFVYDNDESTPYTYNFSLSKDAVEKKYGDRVRILTCSNVLDEEMEEPVRELAEKGCDIIFFNGYSNLVMELAQEYPDIQFCQASYMDMSDQTVPANYHSFKGEAYQGRYVSGIAAGMKMRRMISDGILSADQAVLGFVAAFPTSEVISGYTAFFLGLTSVYPNASMEVDYTNSWFDVDKEAAMAEKFISDGCIIISQHADSTGAPSACQKALKDGTTVYSVGYNVDMLEVAPDAALTSAGNVWGVYYTYAFQQLLDGKPIDTDWAEGYNEDAVHITPLGKSCAEGTEEKVEEVIAGLKDGSIKVFDTANFTVSKENIALTKDKSGAVVTTDADGHVTSVKEDLSYYDFSSGSPELVYEGKTIEAIKDGAFAESDARSAPYFNVRIDGITELS